MEISMDSIKVGTKLFGYEVKDIIENEHPIFGTLYILKGEDEEIQLYTLELFNNIELWTNRAKGV